MKKNITQDIKHKNELDSLLHKLYISDVLYSRAYNSTDVTAFTLSVGKLIS